MRIHTFQELVSRINNLSTRNGKPIHTTWSGTDAYTNTTTVNLPTLPAGTILTPHQFAIWLGYDIHEGPGHQVHTDLELYQKTCRIRNSPQFSYILNLLEDIRIENADLNIYPGDRKYLDAVHHFIDSKIPTHLAQNPDTMGLIYRHLFVHHRQLDTNIIRDKELDPTLIKLLSQIDHCYSTQDCIYLADKIVSYLNQNQEKSNEENQTDKEENNNNNNTNDENADSKGDNKNNSRSNQNVLTPTAARDAATDGETNQSENETLAGDNDADEETNNKETQSETSGKNGSSSSASAWQELTEIKHIINELKNQIETIAPIPLDIDLKDKSIFPPANILNDRIYVPSKEDLSTYIHTRLNASSQILSLKKMFRIYLQAKTTKSQIRGLEEGKLDTQRLHIAACGATTIFKDQYLKLLPLTAIELMIDMSGSMDANIARTAAIILAEGLNSIPQIKLSISGFTTNHKIGNKPHPNSGRHHGMDILQFKDFNEPYTKCRAKLGAINNSGMTPLGDAYGHALEHLIPRPETRRIILLITDGNPEFSHGSNHSDYLLMQKIHLTAKRFHIQTLGLGIGHNLEFLNNYFDQVVNISEISTLPKNLLEALKFFI